MTPSILATVDIVIAVGAEPEATLAEFAHALGLAPPELAHAGDEARENGVRS